MKENIYLDANMIYGYLINEIVLKVKIKKRLSNKNHEREQGLQDSNEGIGRKESESFSARESNFTRRIREEGNGNNEESCRKGRKEGLVSPSISLAGAYPARILLAVIFALTFAIPLAFAAHNPSVSHSANGTFLDNHFNLEVRP